LDLDKWNRTGLGRAPSVSSSKQKLKVMNTNKLTTEQLILIIILMMGLINGLMSCSTRQIAHTPSHREIRRAMEYSTWEYKSANPKYKYELISVKENMASHN
jgi:hypothetical protein